MTVLKALEMEEKKELTVKGLRFMELVE